MNKLFRLLPLAAALGLAACGGQSGAAALPLPAVKAIAVPWPKMKYA